MAAYPYGASNWGPALPPHLQNPYQARPYPYGAGQNPGAYPVSPNPAGAVPPGPGDVPGSIPDVNPGGIPGLLPTDPSASPLPSAKDTPANVASRSREPNPRGAGLGTSNARGTASAGPTRTRELPLPDPDAHPRMAGLKVQVPAQARVFLNGRELKGTGTVRRFSPEEPLVPGVAYKFAIRVELRQDGRTLEKSASISLRPGKLTQLDFDFPVPQDAGRDGSPKVASQR